MINQSYLPQQNKADILKKFDALRTVMRFLKVWQLPTNKKQIGLLCENGFKWSPGKRILFFDSASCIACKET